MADNIQQNANSSDSSKASSSRRIEYATWKIPYSAVVSTSQLGIYSLFDLLYYEDGSKNILPRQSVNGDSKGLRLEHDIICLDTAILTDQGQVDTTKSTFDGWASRGIDMIVAEPDRRAPAVIKEIPTDINAAKEILKIQTYNKDNISIYTNLGKLMDINIKAGAGKTEIENDNTTWQLEKYSPLSVYGTDDANLHLNNQDIILCERDSSFETSMISAANKVYPYNALLINIQSNNILRRVYRILLKNSVLGKSLIDDGGLITNQYADVVNNLIQTDALNLKNPQLWTSESEKMKDILSHVFVYLRCSYFGDYVKYQDFNQDLNEDSNVVHKNIMISSDGDFNRYDKYMPSETRQSSKNTRSYLPQTSPSEDLLSDVIAEKESLKNYKDGGTKSIEELRSIKYKDKTLVGSFWTENINENQGDLTHKDHLSPIQYYDIEAVKPNSEYADEANEKPVLIPESGNIIADGRIFSPTIDEIWSYFKKLVSGRDNDDDLKTKGDIYSGIGYDEGTIINTNKTVGDTRPSEGRQLHFNEGHVSKGDPISLKIVNDGNLETLKVDSWVNTPDSFKMVVYDYMVSVSDEVVRFSKEDWSSDGDNDKSKVIKNNKNVPNNISHDIRTIAAESKSEYTDYGTTNGESNSLVPSSDNNIFESGEYGPREKPYSLRELELLLKNCKYNINSLMHFLVKNFTVNNQLSFRSKEDDCNQTQTALYQFHRDYNSDLSNPNTYFNKKGRDTLYKDSPYLEGEEGGISAVFNDKDVIEEGSTIEGLVPHTDGAIYGSASTLPKNANDYSSSDVYLAADGTWRYLFDHVRTPVLSVKY